MELNRSVLKPRESGKLISIHATDVSMVDDGIDKIAQEIVKNLENGKLSPNNFSQSSYHPKPDDPRAVDWIFVIDTLNFCFWNSADGKKWKVDGQSGYFGLCAAIKRALEDGIPITDSSFLSKISQDQLKHILREDENSGEVPLLEERVKNLNEVGKVLLAKYKGTFLECIKSCNNSSESLLKLIVEDFECYRDEATYQNQKVSFYKRAQILIGDVWACFQGRGIGAFNDIEYITMFPDYRVPQVLLHFNAIKYSEKLLDKLSSGEYLEVGCNEEIEIRGCSIEVVERVVRAARILIAESAHAKLKKSDCNSILVDHYLWDYRRKHANELEHLPYHKVRTIYY
ncbi:hypothetical protein QAD02_012231 [Eretmocerus hayati]|uniref:Uncharacterized protein n=1 Tax=Eretmocerus hayati TaxID=131215 RepID=A0ACC2P1P3_9HYME|nr:hypothetical protein QAD02_012231 [Eretmocerus hayati]